MTRTSDDDRLAEWVRLHGEAVRGFILALVRRPDVADDLEQEVFCRAWEARGSYVEQGKSRAYLLKIADHLVCDRSRCPVLEKTLSDQQWIQCEPFSRVPDPPDAAVASAQAGSTTFRARMAASASGLRLASSSTGSRAESSRQVTRLVGV